MLRKASRKLSSYYDEALAPLGVNIAQFSLLRNINRLSPASLTDLANAAELDRSTVGRNAKVLEKLGFVAFTQGADQREALVALTDAGYDLLDRGAPLWDEVQATIDEKLGPGGVEKLHDLLTAL